MLFGFFNSPEEKSNWFELLEGSRSRALKWSCWNNEGNWKVSVLEVARNPNHRLNYQPLFRNMSPLIPLTNQNAALGYISRTDEIAALRYLSRTNKIAELGYVTRTNHITVYGCHVPITTFGCCFLVNHVVESGGCAHRLALTRNFGLIWQILWLWPLQEPCRVRSRSIGIWKVRLYFFIV